MGAGGTGLKWEGRRVVDACIATVMAQVRKDSEGKKAREERDVTWSGFKSS